MDSDTTSKEAVQKVKESAEALQKAQAEQIDQSNRASEERMTDAFKGAIKEAFSTDEGGQKRFIDITRIPLICNTIISVESRLESIEDNQKWVTRLILGGVILAVLAQVIPHVNLSM